MAGVVRPAGTSAAIRNVAWNTTALMFMLLIFQEDDAVMDVRAVRAPGVLQATRLAQAVLTALPDAAGYQLWQNGACVASTYPRSRRQRWRAPAHPGHHVAQ
jgi:hypothetical protein